MNNNNSVQTESPETKRQKISESTMSNSSAEGKTVLVTGGAGFIGTHVCVDLLEQGYNVVVVDNLVNSSAMSLDRVQKIVGLDDEARKKRLILHVVDICDEPALRKVFESSPTFVACIHFAGLKVRKKTLVHVFLCEFFFVFLWNLF